MIIHAMWRNRGIHVNPTMQSDLSLFPGHGRYGQTGSGKTYTMMGPDENPDVNRRAISELITMANTASDSLEIKVAVSIFEVSRRR